NVQWLWFVVVVKYWRGQRSTERHAGDIHLLWRTYVAEKYVFEHPAQGKRIHRHAIERGCIVAAFASGRGDAKRIREDHRIRRRGIGSSSTTEHTDLPLRPRAALVCNVLIVQRQVCRAPEIWRL